MLAFDPLNPKGPAGAALYATASLLSTLPVFIELCEVVTAAEALAKISIGIHKSPADNDQFGIEELKNMMLQANIYPPVPSQSSVVRGTGSPSPMMGGAFTVLLRRHARDAEIASEPDRNSAFLAWHDYVTAVYTDLIAAAEFVDCPRLRGIVPECDGAFGMLGEVSAQREYLWGAFNVLWGDEAES